MDPVVKENVTPESSEDSEKKRLEQEIISAKLTEERRLRKQWEEFNRDREKKGEKITVDERRAQERLIKQGKTPEEIEKILAALKAQEEVKPSAQTDIEPLGEELKEYIRSGALNESQLKNAHEQIVSWFREMKIDEAQAKKLASDLEDFTHKLQEEYAKARTVSEDEVQAARQVWEARAPGQPLPDEVNELILNGKGPIGGGADTLMIEDYQDPVLEPIVRELNDQIQLRGGDGSALPLDYVRRLRDQLRNLVATRAVTNIDGGNRLILQLNRWEVESEVSEEARRQQSEQEERRPTPIRVQIRNEIDEDIIRMLWQNEGLTGAELDAKVAEHVIPAGKDLNPISLIQTEIERFMQRTDIPEDQKFETLRNRFRVKQEGEGGNIGGLRQQVIGLARALGAEVGGRDPTAAAERGAEYEERIDRVLAKAAREGNVALLRDLTDEVLRPLQTLRDSARRESRTFKPYFSIQEILEDIMTMTGGDYSRGGKYELIGKNEAGQDIVRQENVLRWARKKMYEYHDSDPDNPVNMWERIYIVGGARQTSITEWIFNEAMFTDTSGATPKYLDALRNQIYYELWLFNRSRDTDAIYRLIMQTDKDLPEKLHEIYKQNAFTKVGTLDRILTLPNVDGKVDFENSDTVRESNQGTGAAFRRALLSYYYIMDREMLNKIDINNGNSHENTSVLLNNKNFLEQYFAHHMGKWTDDNPSATAEQRQDAEAKILMDGLKYIKQTDKYFTEGNRGMSAGVLERIRRSTIYSDNYDDIEEVNRITDRNPEEQARKRATRIEEIRKRREYTRRNWDALLEDMQRDWNKYNLDEFEGQVGELKRKTDPNNIHPENELNSAKRAYFERLKKELQGMSREEREKRIREEDYIYLINPFNPVRKPYELLDDVKEKMRFFIMSKTPGMTYDEAQYAETFAYSMTRWTGLAGKNDPDTVGTDAWTKVLLTRGYRDNQAASIRGGMHGNPYSLAGINNLGVDFLVGTRDESGKSILRIIQGGDSDNVDFDTPLAETKFTRDTMSKFAEDHIDRAFILHHDLIQTQGFNFDQFVTINQWGDIIIDYEKANKFMDAQVKSFRYAYSSWAGTDYSQIVRVRNQVTGEIETKSLGEHMWGKQVYRDFIEKKIGKRLEHATHEEIGKAFEDREMRRSLFKRPLMYTIAAEMFAHTKRKSGFSKYKAADVEKIYDFLKTFAGEIDPNEEELSATKRRGRFFSKEDIMWIRNASRTGIWRVMWREYSAESLAGIWDGGLKAIGKFLQSLNQTT